MGLALLWTLANEGRCGSVGAVVVSFTAAVDP
jgi:hypothetical protein